MRCPTCGWILRADECPCHASRSLDLGSLVPIGSSVLARSGRGPSMDRWRWGSVAAHTGRLHKVQLDHGDSWCEPDDLVLERNVADDLLVVGTRVWGLWLDGRFYPGTIDDLEAHLRHVHFDDDDCMWIESRQLFVMVVSSSPLRPGAAVLAPRWDGKSGWATLEQQEADRCRVTFQDGDEEWVPCAALQSPPPNPFLE